MIWLMGELLVYLGSAAVIGFLAGWLLRGIKMAETREVLEERFRQMLASAEMERDAARIRVRELGYQLDSMEERVNVLLGEADARSRNPAPLDVPQGEVGAPSAPEVEVAPSAVPSAPSALEAPTVETHPAPPTPVESATPEREEGAPATLDRALRKRVEDPSGTPSHDRMGGTRTAEEEEAAALWRQALERPESRWKEAPGGASETAVPSDSAVRSEGTPESPPSLEAAPQNPPPVATPGSQRLQEPESLGGVAGLPAEIRQSLEALGIMNTRQLARRTRSSTDQDDLAASLGVEPRLVRRWGGLADLMQVPGVGPEEARLLEASGLGSVVELADEDPAELSQRMALLNRDQGLGLPDPARDAVEGWIRFAAEASGTLQNT